MKLKNIKPCIVAFLCITALFTSVTVSAQMRQARGGQAPNAQYEASVPDENKQALREIEMMREMIRERREQQEQQRRVLQELQQAAGIPSTPAAQPRYKEPEPSYQPTPTQQRVTSGSILSQIDAEEREDKGALQQKYNLEIQVAQKEIEMLKKQLSIANRQLDQCQAGSVNVNNTSAYNDMPAFSEPKQKKVKPQKQKKERHQASQQAVAQPQQSSSENKQAMQEIEMMREMLRERREQQEQQRRMIQDLQQALD